MGFAVWGVFAQSEIILRLRLPDTQWSDFTQVHSGCGQAGAAQSVIALRDDLGRTLHVQVQSPLLFAALESHLLVSPQPPKHHYAPRSVTTGERPVGLLALPEANYFNPNPNPGGVGLFPAQGARRVL